MKQDDAVNVKFSTTRREKGWRVIDVESEMEVRYVAREYQWARLNPRRSFTGTAVDKLRWNCIWVTFMGLRPRVDDEQFIKYPSRQTDFKGADANGESCMST